MLSLSVMILRAVGDIVSSMSLYSLGAPVLIGLRVRALIALMGYTGLR
ncbi:MAG: hypothetical protein NVS9B4_27230 [Candidatus Acidiferrum sp.]